MSQDQRKLNATYSLKDQPKDVLCGYRTRETLVSDQAFEWVEDGELAGLKYYNILVVS